MQVGRGASSGAVVALPSEEAEIGDLGDLPDDWKAEQERKPFEYRQSLPDGGESIDADLPGAVSLAGMELAKKILSGLAGRQLVVAKGNDVDRCDQVIAVDATVERDFLAADRATAIIPD